MGGAHQAILHLEGGGGDGKGEGLTRQYFTWRGVRWEGGGAHQAVLHLERGGVRWEGGGAHQAVSLGGKGPPLLLPSYLEAIYVCPVWGGNEGGGRVKSGV